MPSIRVNLYQHATCPFIQALRGLNAVIASERGGGVQGHEMLRWREVWPIIGRTSGREGEWDNHGNPLLFVGRMLGHRRFYE